MTDRYDIVTVTTDEQSSLRPNCHLEPGAECADLADTVPVSGLVSDKLSGSPSRTAM
jgi:hypothetical protein